MAAETLKRAVEKAEALPLPDQERIAVGIERFVESLSELRDKLDQGVHSLDAGLGKALDIEEVIARANTGHAER